MSLSLVIGLSGLSIPDPAVAKKQREDPVVTFEPPSEHHKCLVDPAELTGQASTGSDGNPARFIYYTIRELPELQYVDECGRQLKGRHWQQASVDLDGAWSIPVDLPRDKYYRLGVRAISETGQKSRWTYQDFSLAANEVRLPDLAFDSLEAGALNMIDAGTSIGGVVTDNSGYGIQSINYSFQVLGDSAVEAAVTQIQSDWIVGEADLEGSNWKIVADYPADNPFRVYVWAVDVAGRLSTPEHRDVTLRQLDLDPPVSTIAVPAVANDVVAAQSMFEGHVTDNSGVDSVQILLRTLPEFQPVDADGQVVPQWEPMTAAVESTGQWTFDISLQPDQAYRVSVRGIDSAGNAEDWQYRDFLTEKPESIVVTQSNDPPEDETGDPTTVTENNDPPADETGDPTGITDNNEPPADETEDTTVVTENTDPPAAASGDNLPITQDDPADYVFTFQGHDEVLTLDITSTDVESGSQVQVLVNSQPIGFLQQTTSGDSGITTLPVSSSVQQPGPNKLAFQQQGNGNTWAVVDVSIATGCNYPLVIVE